MKKAVVNVLSVLLIVSSYIIVQAGESGIPDNVSVAGEITASEENEQDILVTEDTKDMGEVEEPTDVQEIGDVEKTTAIQEMGEIEETITASISEEVTADEETEEPTVTPVVEETVVSEEMESPKDSRNMDNETISEGNETSIDISGIAGETASEKTEETLIVSEDEKMIVGEEAEGSTTDPVIEDVKSNVEQGESSDALKEEENLDTVEVKESMGSSEMDETIVNVDTEETAAEEQEEIIQEMEGPEEVMDDSIIVDTLQTTEVILPEDVIQIEIPTVAPGQFDFILDPQGVIYETHGAKYDNATFAPQHTLYFKNTADSSEYMYSNSSDAVTIINKSTTEVEVTVTVIDDAGFEFVKDREFSDEDTSAGIYLELTDGDQTVVLDSTEAVSIQTRLAAAPENAYVLQWNEALGRNEYVLSNEAQIDGYTGYAEHSFRLMGACNPYGDWLEFVGVTPSIRVTWDTKVG